MADLMATFEAHLWRYEGTAPWYFVSLPADLADEIDERFAAHVGGFGSVRVEVRIGATSWATSVFPDKRSGTYLLPVKKAVRAAEGLQDGSPTVVQLTVRQP